ncbi:hypothetical protein GCM10009682_53020 [Luedemannella flava]|uniref:DUF3533 domain-containing protein n=1 Tax=Luedemannella flava TaxID=349316 RepID=A0ABP4YPY0_9ACTN
MTEPHESPPTPASRVDDALGSGDEPPGSSPTYVASHAAPPEPHDAAPPAGSAVDDALGASDEPSPAGGTGRAPPEFALGEMPIHVHADEPLSLGEMPVGHEYPAPDTEPALPDTAGGTPSSPLIWRGMWHVPRYAGDRFWKAWAGRAAILLAGVLLLTTAFIAAYVGGLHEPTPRDIPVGVVTGDQTATQLLSILDERTGLVTGHEFATRDAATAALDRREVFAVVAGGAAGLQLTVSSGAGQPVAQILAGAVAAVGQAAGVQVTTVDAYPLTAHDPRGLVAFYLVVGLTLGGYLAATVLGLSLGTAPRDLMRATARIGAFAAFSLLLGLAGAILVGPVFDIWTGHTLGLTLGGALVAFTAAAITSALQGWLGMVGTGLAILLLVVLGNPGSGGVFPWPFLPSFFRGMHVWLPTGLGTDLTRAVAYYARAGAGLPVAGLLVWSLAGVVGTFAAAVTRGRRGEHAL